MIIFRFSQENSDSKRNSVLEKSVYLENSYANATSGIHEDNTMKQFERNSGSYDSFDGASIYYEVAREAQAPALLLLHGGFGSQEDFSAILPAFEKGFKVPGFESPSNNGSISGGETLTYSKLQRDVEDILNQLEIDRLGFRNGGVVAYRLASLTFLKVDETITLRSRWQLKNIEPSKQTVQ